jgi:hypothetical protein
MRNRAELSPKLAVGLPNDCERIAVEVPVPGLKDSTGKRLTQRMVLRRTQAALLLANDRLVEVKGCVAEMRAAYQPSQ